MTGTPLATDCNVYTDGNSGCTVLAPTGNSFGPAFNANGGGWYAIERTSSFVRVFFWPRYSGVPSDVASGSSSVNTDAWVSFRASQIDRTTNTVTVSTGHSCCAVS